MRVMLARRALALPRRALVPSHTPLVHRAFASEPERLPFAGVRGVSKPRVHTQTELSSALTAALSSLCSLCYFSALSSLCSLCSLSSLLMAYSHYSSREGESLEWPVGRAAFRRPGEPHAEPRATHIDAEQPERCARARAPHPPLFVPSSRARAVVVTVSTLTSPASARGACGPARRAPRSWCSTRRRARTSTRTSTATSARSPPRTRSRRRRSTSSSSTARTRRSSARRTRSCCARSPRCPATSGSATCRTTSTRTTSRRSPASTPTWT